MTRVFVKTICNERLSPISVYNETQEIKAKPNAQETSKEKKKISAK